MDRDTGQSANRQLLEDHRSVTSTTAASELPDLTHFLFLFQIQRHMEPTDCWLLGLVCVFAWRMWSGPS